MASSTSVYRFSLKVVAVAIADALSPIDGFFLRSILARWTVVVYIFLTLSFFYMYAC